MDEEIEEQQRKQEREQERERKQREIFDGGNTEGGYQNMFAQFLQASMQQQEEEQEEMIDTESKPKEEVGLIECGLF